MATNKIRFDGFETRPDLIPILEEMFASVRNDFGAFTEQVSSEFKLERGQSECPFSG